MLRVADIARNPLQLDRVPVVIKSLLLLDHSNLVGFNDTSNAHRCSTKQGRVDGICGFGTSHQGDQIAAGQRPIGNRHIFGDTDISDDGISSQGDRVGMGDIIADAIAKRHELRMKLIDSK